MELIVGAKLKDKRRDAWLAALTDRLDPGEQVTVLVRNNLVRPTCSALALTTARVLAFFHGDLDRKGFKIELRADDLVRAELASKRGSTYLVLTRKNGETVTAASLDKEDADAVLEVTRQLVATGPPELGRRLPGPSEATPVPQAEIGTPAAGSPDSREPEEIATARNKVGAAARTTVAHVRAFAERATALLSVPAVLRESARHQTEVLTAQQVDANLRTKPVTTLREFAGRGARLAALDEAGYTTVADVSRSSPYQLQAIPGIGPQTAQQVTQAARHVQAQVARETRFRFDPDRRTPAQTQLLATLASARHADAVAGSLRGPLRQFTEQTTPLVADAERTGSRVSMFFSGRQKKQNALAALAKLDAVLADPRVVSLQETVRQQEHAVRPESYDAEQLWRDYAQDAAAFNTLLSTVGGAGQEDETEAAQGFIPPELRQQIVAFPLDTSLLKVTLRGYQVFGAQYAIHRENSILGDEMGLGKTVEALAALAHLAANGQRRFLVVCPASVQINWMNEIRKHSALAGHNLHGTDRDRATRRWLRDGGVAVTTFNTLGRLPGIAEADIAMLVVDEAHYVKNPDAQRSKTIRGAIGRAQRTLFLTGTPMENRVEEFRNLVNYLQPRLASGIDASDAISGARAFRRAVAPVYLRRNQEDVLTELPEMIEVEDWVHLTRDDETAYVSAVQSRNLMQMRQAAFHAGDSAKLERLREIVEEARQDGRKVVVFSYFLHVLDRIERALGPAVLGKLTGSVAANLRQGLVDEFTRCDGHAVLLSQVEAGGVGLNVQAASIVILTEPQWKPSTEEQAIARAHRMGQIRTVQVHRLLAKGCVDERLCEIQQHKRLLFAEFADKSDAKDADQRAVDRTDHRPTILDDEAISLTQRVVLAEQHRLGVS